MEYNNEKYYFTGKPCKYGHIDVRLKSNRRCKSCLIEARKLWYKTDRGKILKSISDNKYYEANKEKLIEKAHTYYGNHKSKYKYLSKKRKWRIKIATPSWADLNKIREFYENCPDGYEVDHIIPLRGKNISGLHVIENLQYLTKKENRAKSNKFEPSGNLL